MKARRFLNVLMDSYGGGSLSRIINPRKHLFYPSTAQAQQHQIQRAAAAAKAKAKGSTPAAIIEEKEKVGTPEEEDESTAEDNYDGVLRLPTPKLSFKTSRQMGGGVTSFDFLPFYGGSGTGEGEERILCVDGNGMTALYDIEAATVEMMPSLSHKPNQWRNPISLCVTHTTAADEDDPSRPDAAHDPAQPDALYVMDIEGNNFEALVYDDPKPPSQSKVMDIPYRRWIHNDRCVWHWRKLPPPPIVVDEGDDYGRGRGGSSIFVESYALVHGHGGDEDASSSSNTICVSFGARSRDGWSRHKPTRTGGTYCFDTGTGKWTKAGDWKLPFSSRALHIPELGDDLLFGFEKTGLFLQSDHFSVVDVSGALRMDGSAPALRHAWVDIDPPPRWNQQACRSVVYIGDGRFCIHRTFNIMETDGWGSGEDCVDTVVLLTGIEVVREGSRLRMIKHRSIRLDTCIDSIL